VARAQGELYGRWHPWGRANTPCGAAKRGQLLAWAACMAAFLSSVVAPQFEHRKNSKF